MASAGKTKREPAVGWGAMLESVPVRNAAARVERRDKTIVVHVPRTPHRNRLVGWFIGARAERLVELDALGSGIWDLCDGTRSVEAVIDAFARQHALTFHESRVAVTDYLRQLIRRGVLAIAMREPS